MNDGTLYLYYRRHAYRLDRDDLEYSRDKHPGTVSFVEGWIVVEFKQQSAVES